MPPSERHAPHSYEYADAAAREAATGFVTTDLNKWALQLDDGSYWRLTATTPAWVAVGGGGTPPSSSDPYWSNVTLALHCDGTNGSTAITDEKGHTVTTYGNVQISTAQSKFGGASMYCDGAGDYITLPNGIDFNISAGDFTLEFQVRPASTGQGYAFAFGAGPSALACYCYNNSIYAESSSNGSTWDVINNANLGSCPAGQFTHIEFSRQGTALRCFVGGVLKLTATTSASLYYASLLLGIGARADGSYAFNGHIDEFRITKGIARNTADFTPPTAAFLNA